MSPSWWWVVASTVKQTVGGRSWPVAGFVAGLGGGLVAWAVVRWWRLRRNRVIQ